MTQDPNAASPLLNLPGTGDAADIDLGGTPRPWWRRRGPIIGISVALLVILLGGLLFTLLNRKPPVKYEYQPVQIRNLALTISATGPLTSAVYNLVFNGQSGGVIIDEIDVKVGQKVVAGQVVAKLNKTSLQDVYNEQLAAVRTDQNNLNSAMNELLKTEGLTNANVASAQTSLSNSRASLTTTLAASQQAVVVAETTLSNDQANLIQVQNEAQASISVAQTTLSNDQANLTQVQNEAQASISVAQTTLSNDQTALTQVLSVSQASISAAQTTLSNAQASLTQAQNAAQASISVAQTTLSNDQAALTQVQNQSQASISAAQTTLSNAQASLAQATTVANAQIAQALLTEQTAIAACTTPPTQPCIQAAKDAYNVAVASANAPVQTAQNAVNAAQQTLNQATATANANIQAAQAKVTADQQALNNARATANASIQTAQNAVNTAQQALNQARATANANNQTAQAKVTADQQALNQARATANANNQTAQAKVTADQQALNQAIATANANVQTAQAKVTADQQTLNQAIATANQSNTTAQGMVNSNQAGVNTSQASGESSIASAQQVVISDEGLLNSAEELLAADKHNLDNSILKAPHAGVVTVINGTVGGAPGLPQNASTSSTTTSGNTFIQIVDTSNLQVQASVNETDTANLKIGEPATFTVNAYPNKTFRGTVGAISPLGQTVSNVVTYPVRIDIDMSSVNGTNLIPGMTANVTITVVSRVGVLLIPVNAVDFARLASTRSTSGTPPLISSQAATSAMIEARQMLINLLQSQPSLSAEGPTPAYVLESPTSGQFIAKPVVLGLTDGTQYEVLEGLTTADTVVVGIASSALTGANTNTGPGSGG